MDDIGHLRGYAPSLCLQKPMLAKMMAMGKEIRDKKTTRKDVKGVKHGG
jgi:hypothetical protein